MAERVARVVGESPRRRIGLGTILGAVIAAAVLLAAGVFASAPPANASSPATHRTAKASSSQPNQQQIPQVWPFLTRHRLRLLDWLPWSHTFGANHNFGLVLFNGGSLYIDEGKPLPGAIEATVRNLREVAPNWYFTVPKGYEMPRDVVSYVARCPLPWLDWLRRYRRKDAAARIQREIDLMVVDNK